MRVVSLVPSWTETLVHAGVEVVGRTRFCVHPAAMKARIPAVGGTKNWDFKRIRELKPDLIVLDKEENPRFMAEQREFPVLATHVTDLASVATSLSSLADRIEKPELAEVAARWQAIAAAPELPRWHHCDPLPGVVEWVRKPTAPVTNVIYMIWRNPWMSVSRNTFIGGVLTKCGLGPYLRDFEDKYPKINLADFSPETTLLLFATEPYPFLRKRSVLNPINHPYAFADGESFSWFGVRALKFLESLRAGL
jgi:iron complex transport system substrate-binding protein